MDAQAATQITGLGQVSLINVVDATSRVKVESCPRVDCDKPGTNDYYLALRRAFLTYGLPWRLSLDHDTVFLIIQSRRHFRPGCIYGSSAWGSKWCSPANAVRPIMP